MKLMGMKGWLHWSALYFKFSMFMVISAVIITFFLHIKVPDRAVITYTDPSVTFVILLLYSLSVMTMCFAISTFFSRGTLCALSEWDGYNVKYRLIPYRVNDVDGG